MINRDSRGHSYFIVRGEILGFMKDEQLRKHTKVFHSRGYCSSLKLSGSRSRRWNRLDDFTGDDEPPSRWIRLIFVTEGRLLESFFLSGWIAASQPLSVCMADLE